MQIASFKIIFGMKRGYAYVWGTCKDVLVLRVCFLKSKSIQAKNFQKVRQDRLFTTTMGVPHNFGHAMFLGFLRLYNQILPLSGTTTRPNTGKARWMGLVVQ